MMDAEKNIQLLKYYHNHPYEYVIDILNAVPSTKQREILETIPKAIKERKGIAIKSGHGVGKTALASWIINWFMSTRLNPKIPCTAPTQHQLYDILWSELRKWHQKNIYGATFDWTATKFFNKKYPETSFAVARTARTPEGLQGFHGEDLLFIVDEASGVASEIIEVIEGSQTQEGSCVILLGNPTVLSGGFYDAFHSKREFYYCFTVSTIDVAQERPDIADPNYGPKISKKYGEDSDVYRVRVLGEFPTAETNTLISLSLAENASTRVQELGPHEIVEIGVDVARFGDDETTIWSRVNNVIRKETILKKRDTMYVAGQVANIIKKYHDTKIVYCNVDDSGVGGGVTDRLKELCQEGEIKATIFGVNNGSRAMSSDLFINLGTEMWFFMKEWLKTGSIPIDDDLIAQLSTRRYSLNSSGKNMIEPKEQMKRRGLISPDRADGAILTLYSLIYTPKSVNSRSYAR